jgi:thiosulfate dehydrogenase [quinone] large subunit
MQEAPLSHYLFCDTHAAWAWLAVRLYVGWAWLEAGWHKVTDAAWVGDGAGGAMTGFIQRSITKMSGPHPDVQSWYGAFLEHAVLPHAALWSHVVAYGELFVGIGLILGAFTGIAAFFGLFMNLNFLLAGTVSTNPVLLMLAALLMMAWKTAGYIGVDRYLLPRLGVPWRIPKR